jgi:hypothetical protein
VSYVGNDNQAFELGDLDVDGDIDSADWEILRSNQHTNLAGKSLAEAYRLGDLTGDLANNHPDFVTFKNVFESTNGAGSFAAMVAQVPEPTTATLITSIGILSLATIGRRKPS